MGAAQLSVEMKLEHEKEYIKKLEKEKSKITSFGKSIENSYKEINKIKKYNLNILYYDEHLRDEEENSDNCSFIEMNINGTFYGCHNFELFKIICEKIKNKNKEFILLSSGSAAKKIYDYCSNIKEIREYYIYCCYKEKYIPLMNQYPKLKGVYNIFESMKDKLYNINQMNIDNISSSNLIFFEDYSKKYIKLHYEFIRKYSLYKILKANNCNETQFLYLISKKYPYFLNQAKQLFPNKNETIDYFLKNTDEKYSKLSESFKCDDNFLDDNIKSYINNYTDESFYYKYLNKFLRQGNFDAFRKLSTHISKFIFKLYDYREKNILKQKNTNLYRKMYLTMNDIKFYEKSINKVICYPSFTSTSIIKNGFIPNSYGDNNQLVQLIIEQNNTKSTVSIREFSVFQKEEEYLFLPFSFFKIINVQIKSGTINDPHIINLIALNSDKPLEDIFLEFFKKVTDNLNPEGLDLLILTENNTKIILNPIFHSFINH